MTSLTKLRKADILEPEIRYVRTVDLSKFKAYVDAINSSLAALYHQDSPLFSVVKGTLLGVGKRIRPVLSLLSCEAVSGDYRAALPIATAYELAHNASLVQDDIIDRAEKRRDSSTVYAEYGLNTAILVSDMLIFEIFTRIGEYQKHDLPRRRLYMLLNLIGEASKATTVGEYMDEDLARKDNVYEEEYVEMVRNKTGAMLGALAACGAVVGGGSLRQVHALYRFGEKHGIAYQIQDDVLDIMSNEELMGKPVFNDIRNRRKNLVLIHAMRSVSNKEKELIRRLYGRQSFPSHEIRRLRAILTDSGSIDYARNMALAMAADGRAQLRKLRPSIARDKLEELSYAIMRGVA